MWDEKGKPRSFSKFKEASESVISQYNTNWLETEYSTAMIRANFAQQWREIERNVDIFPNIIWLPSTSVNPRSQHVALYNKVFAFDDPFLKSNYPGSLWGCKCSISSTSESVTDGEKIKASKRSTSKASKGLDQNPGTSGALFSGTHPYVADCTKKEKKSVGQWCSKRISEQKPLNPKNKNGEKH